MILMATTKKTKKKPIKKKATKKAPKRGKKKPARRSSARRTAVRKATIVEMDRSAQRKIDAFLRSPEAEPSWIREQRQYQAKVAAEHEKRMARQDLPAGSPHGVYSFSASYDLRDGSGSQPFLPAYSVEDARARILKDYPDATNIRVGNPQACDWKTPAGGDWVSAADADANHY